MFISILMLSFGGITLLLAIIKTIIYLKNYKKYLKYKTVKGCVVEHLSKEGHINFDDEEFGFDAICYDEDDTSFLIQDGINTNAGIVEYVVKGKKYRLVDTVFNTNLMPIGKEILVKYNPLKPKEAILVDDFDIELLYAVGLFLIMIGIYASFNF